MKNPRYFFFVSLARNQQLINYYNRDWIGRKDFAFMSFISLPYSSLSYLIKMEKRGVKSIHNQKRYLITFFGKDIGSMLISLLYYDLSSQKMRQFNPSICLCQIHYQNYLHAYNTKRYTSMVRIALHCGKIRQLEHDQQQFNTSLVIFSNMYSCISANVNDRIQCRHPGCPVILVVRNYCDDIDPYDERDQYFCSLHYTRAWGNSLGHESTWVKHNLQFSK